MMKGFAEVIPRIPVSPSLLAPTLLKPGPEDFRNVHVTLGLFSVELGASL